MMDDKDSNLTIGQILGHFQLTSLLGKGGMGEVYQAKDLKLGRGVALKVLPEEFARDADRAARFQREAKLLASLNHPYICTIHDIDEHAGQHFIAMELMEGQTLKQRMLGQRLTVWRRLTPKGSFIGTSSRRTSSSPRRATPKSWISGWQS
jgi:serine/threonine protein kinase